MAEQESIQTQLDTLRYDMDELVKGRETQAENMRNLGGTLLREHTLLSRLVIQHETFVQDTVKALQLFQKVANSQEKELHLLRDTVASLQQDVATLEEKFANESLDREWIRRLSEDVQHLEEKFPLMEEVTNVTVSLDETDEGGAERAEREHFMAELEAEEDARASQSWERRARPFDPGYLSIDTAEAIGD